MLEGYRTQARPASRAVIGRGAAARRGRPKHVRVKSRFRHATVAESVQAGVRQRPQGCYNGCMTLPFSLPDWLPWWVPIMVLVPALLYLLVFLLMPFSVIGLKGRLEAVEARLDEIQGEIRALVLRMPELRGRGLDWNEPLPPIPPARPDDDRLVRPPIPPAPVQVPRRAPVEPSYRAPPEPPDPASRYGEPSYQEPSDADYPPSEGEDSRPGGADDYGPSRRRPVVRPTRPPRSEPRIDWPR